MLTNPAFTGKTVEMLEARRRWSDLAQTKGYRFWPMTRGFLEAVQPLEPRSYSHRQVTDACPAGAGD